MEWVEKIDNERCLFKGRTYLIIKRILDLSLVILSLPISIPLLGLCALVVKIDSPDGPIVFNQPRTGKGGKRFTIYKFRTMVPNAEELKKDLAHLNILKWPLFKMTNDPRITRVGKFLRRTSLDELPQIYNVLKGEMSLVGPRPTTFSPEIYQLWHTERLSVIPGITGLWQITKRGTSDFDEWLRLDIMYIEHRCLWLDIQILARTLFAVLRRRGAF